jgi:hypothetical protein
MVLAYIDARDVQDRLDAVVGPGSWNNRTRRDGDAWIGRVEIVHDDGRVSVREDASDPSDIEAVKGGASGAFKRAAVGFGIGRYLYRLDAPWVDMDGTGKYAKVTSRELKRLQGMLESKAMASDPVWDKRDGGGSGRESAPAEETAAAPIPQERPSSFVLEWELAIGGCECLDDLSDVGKQIAEAGLSEEDKIEVRKLYLSRQAALMP